MSHGLLSCAGGRCFVRIEGVASRHWGKRLQGTDRSRTGRTLAEALAEALGLAPAAERARRGKREAPKKKKDKKEGWLRFMCRRARGRGKVPCRALS